jgi:hypothetical protein
VLWLAQGILLAATQLSLPAAAVAQTSASALSLRPASQASQALSVPRGDVFAGVAVWNEDGHRFTGLHLAGAFRVARHVAVVGEGTFYDHDTRTLMGGVRVYGTATRVTIFGQFLVGSAPLDDIAFQPGFGVDVHLGSHAAIRAAFDVKISGDDGSTYVGTRFSTGLVVRLGRR